MKRGNVLAAHCACALVVTLAAPAWAGWRHELAGCGYVPRHDRPEWIMVFALVDGQLELQTRGRTGVFVSAELPLEEGSFCFGFDRVHGACGTSIVVVSDRPFAVPRGFARRQHFDVGRHAAWNQDDTRRLCRLLGVRPGSVRVTVHSWESTPAYRRALHRACVHAAWPWVGLSSGDRVYVDGTYLGCGLRAFVGVGAGRHRVTVVTACGHKESRWVTLPAPPCEAACALGPWAWR